MDLTNVNNLFINGHRFVAGDLVGKKVKPSGVYYLKSGINLDTGLVDNDSTIVGSSILEVDWYILMDYKQKSAYIVSPVNGGKNVRGGWIGFDAFTVIN